MDKTISLICQAMSGIDPGTAKRKKTSIRENIEPTAPYMLSNADPMGMGYGQDSSEDCEVSDDELNLAKKFITMLGGVERAQKVMDKAAECEDCLGMVDTDEQDEQMIAHISSFIPSDVDMPMGY